MAPRHEENEFQKHENLGNATKMNQTYLMLFATILSSGRVVLCTQRTTHKMSKIAPEHKGTEETQDKWVERISYIFRCEDCAGCAEMAEENAIKNCKPIKKISPDNQNGMPSMLSEELIHCEDGAKEEESDSTALFDSSQENEYVHVYDPLDWAESEDDVEFEEYVSKAINKLLDNQKPPKILKRKNQHP